MISLCRWKDPIDLESDSKAEKGCSIGAKLGKASLSTAIPTQPSHLDQTIHMVNQDLAHTEIHKDIHSSVAIACKFIQMNENLCA